MRLVRAVRHIGQNAEKFRFDLRIENLYICLHEECEISMDWVRGPKRISGKESVSCVNGNIIHPFYQPMVLIATLFQKPNKSSKGKQKDDVFLPKDSRLVVYGKYKENPMPIVLGEVPLELSFYANNLKLSENANSDQTHIEIPLIKCSDPNSYIEAYISCVSLGEVSEGFDDTASMMSGFTTIYSDIGDFQTKASESKLSIENTSSLFNSKYAKSNLTFEKDTKLPSECTLGIPMFAIREDAEIRTDNLRETEEMTETGTVVDVDVHINGENIARSDKKENGNQDALDTTVKNNDSAPSYYPNPVINKLEYQYQCGENYCENVGNNAERVDNDDCNATKGLNLNLNKNGKTNAGGSSSHSSSSFDILTQRLYMEQEEYKRKINEYNMEINSLKQQLQIYSEQEKNWKQREADLMNEIKQLRTNDGSELLRNKDENGINIDNSTVKSQKLVDLNDYCLLQQEVSELTGVRDELRRLRESDKYNYEKYITNLENQLDDIKRQLEYYQRTGKIQDEVEAELFSIPKNNYYYHGSFLTANSQVSDLEPNKQQLKLRVNSSENCDDRKTSKGNNKAKDGEGGVKFSYCYDEIEKELISTKLALAQTETNYQIEINNLKSKIDKQKKQLLSYSSYVGNLEVINADLKYGSKITHSTDIHGVDENAASLKSEDNSLGNKSKNGVNTIHSYWKTIKQRIRQ
ncbi:hypothetical protein FG386_002120 [Cryptosporidium ryanae]|uniref:uncharacterized protein n=1 Tax=Cryptosporidium ryanae TaxID=515981 RepID=UPI00351A6747|nr:hypothetical protein FG386_002120 [Cryptosporidium ryanae]